VRLDVRVVTADGAFVRDLEKKDFQVFEDGREQSITNLALVDLGQRAEAAAEISTASDVASNASFAGGRIHLHVLDDLHINELREGTVRAIASRFIEQYATSRDRIAIATTSGSYAGTREFTNDPTTVPGFNPGAVGGPSGSPRSLSGKKEVVTLQSLLSAVEWLASVPDRRKSIVFVSEGCPSTEVDAAFALQDVVSAAARSSVAIYSVDAHALPSASHGAIARWRSLMTTRSTVRAFTERRPSLSCPT
jgi:VWFA-related protein